MPNFTGLKDDSDETCEHIHFYPKIAFSTLMDIWTLFFAIYIYFLIFFFALNKKKKCPNVQNDDMRRYEKI